MIFVELFIAFCKIGFTSFGGMSMIPLINSEMMNHGWMTHSEVLDIVAIAEMTPGPLGINCATFAGIRTAGVAGALVANLGISMPTLTICALAAVFFEKFKDSKWLKECMMGIRPATLGLIAGALVVLGESNLIVENVFYWPAAVIAIAVGILMYKFKFSIPAAIALSGVMGLVLA